MFMCFSLLDIYSLPNQVFFFFNEFRSLWKCLWRTIGYYRLFNAMVAYGIYAAAGFGPILLLTRIVSYFMGTLEMSEFQIWIFCVLLFVIPEIGSIAATQNNVIMSHVGIQIRNILISLIFRKSLKLSSASRINTSTGQIVNMFSTDTKQLQSLMYFASMIFFAPIQIAVALALIYQQVTESTFVGLGFMIFIVPFNIFVFITMANIRKQMLVVNDQRVKLMNEILAGIRILKYYAWEVAFQQKVMKIRDDELILLRKLAYVIAIGFSMLLLSVPIVQPILIFFTYVRLGNQLDAAKAFTTISLFNLIRFPFAFLPMGLAQYAQAKVSMKRIMDFLCSEELPDYILHSAPDGEPDTVILLKDATFSGCLNEEKKDDEGGEAGGMVIHDGPSPAGECEGDGGVEQKDKDPSAAAVAVEGIELTKQQDKQDPNSVNANANEVANSESNLLNRSIHTLKNLNMRVKKGQLVAVVGSVGSGKSSFLNCLIGELIHRSGM